LSYSPSMPRLHRERRIYNGKTGTVKG